MSVDFSRAWQIVVDTPLDLHDPACSYRVSRRAILCDCAILTGRREYLSPFPYTSSEPPARRPPKLIIRRPEPGHWIWSCPSCCWQEHGSWLAALRGALEHRSLQPNCLHLMGRSFEYGLGLGEIRGGNDTSALPPAASLLTFPWEHR
jgi:hypothetical protein